jgi:hypothetical protein
MVTCDTCVMNSTTAEFVQQGGKCTFCAKDYSEDSQLDRHPKRTGEFDCIIGISGGVDSCYTLVRAVEAGWKPLVFHYDNGWNSNLSVSNIEKIIKKLNLELHTFVTPWRTFKSIQNAFFAADVIDLELPTDHAIFASLYRFAFKSKVRTVIMGYNSATETILPKDWAHRKYDFTNIKDITNKYSQINFSKYPHLTLAQWLFMEHVYIKRYSILNSLHYDKLAAETYLIDEYGFEPYQGKHAESVFTRFYQNYILPEKFGIDKRRAHLSSQIVSGRITRVAAEEELKFNEYIGSKQIKADRKLILSKLGMSESDFKEYLERPRCDHDEYRSSVANYGLLRRMKQKIY